MPHDPPDIVAVSVGNTRTRFGLFRAGELDRSSSAPNADPDLLAREISELSPGARVVLASVNAPVADRLRADLLQRGTEAVARFGRDIEIPIAHTLRDPAAAGQDRLLNALGAYRRSRQACIVIDAGTAITIDFVDGEGTFHGGAIAPGLNMMLRALHGQTASLPLIAYEPRRSPLLLSDAQRTESPFGEDTRSAMLLGVEAAALGAVRALVEHCADYYGGYPQIIATGGDAQLFEGDGLVEHIVPDLTLLGIHAAIESLGAGEPED